MTLRAHSRLLLTPARLGVVALVVATLVTGCGASRDAGAEHDTHVMSDGSTMSDRQMSGMSATSGPSPDAVEASHAGPSDTASMICGNEIAGAVQRSFARPSPPRGVSHWAPPVFACSWALPHSALRMQVADLSKATGGRAWYDDLRGRLPGVRTIKGLQNFGFPAFETRRGDVVFLKEGKTLWVDASKIASTDLPHGFSRTDTAYAVAAAVIGCWTE